MAKRKSTKGQTTSSSPVFSGVPCYSIFSFMCMFCRSLFVFLYFFFWPLCCLFFFDIRILITPLVSSNSSYVGHLRNVELSFITNYDICIDCRYQWPKEKVQKDKQRSTKHTHKTKDRVTRNPTKNRG
jgi:hypothetical protein